MIKLAIFWDIKAVTKYLIILGTIVLVWTILLTTQVLAVQSENTLKVSLGNSAGELKFVPDNLIFKVGQSYKLILDNPSPDKHYFTAKDFADASWSKKVQAGKVEVKGAIHELELKPGATAEWVLTPMKSGKYELHCSIKGHAEAGMIGQIIVED